MQYSEIKTADLLNRSDASDYRRTAKGEIDYYYYVELGRRERSVAAGHLFKALRNAIAGLFGKKEPSGHPAK